MRKNPEPHGEKQRVGNDWPWLLLKTIDAKSSNLFSLLQLPIASILVQS